MSDEHAVTDEGAETSLLHVDYADAESVVQSLAPARPLHIFRPQMIQARIAAIYEQFTGQLGYMVRANSAPAVIKALHASEIHHYACDTIEEIAAIKRLLPDAKILYTHPVKSPESIETAYHKHRVRDFVIDHPEEMEKIKKIAGIDATLIVRLMPPTGALQSEGYRYGCDIDRGVWLAKAIVDAGFKLGLGFDLGSQVLQPALYDEAFLVMREVMYRARYMLDMVWIGGGLPAIYEGAWPRPIESYFDIIQKGLKRLHLPRACRVLCTPGRAIVADSVAVLVRVEQRRGQLLYINDGLLGSLSGINQEWQQPPVRHFRREGTAKTRLSGFMFSGCYSHIEDVMAGPFYLPQDTDTGDYIEIGQQGAYAGSMHSVYNRLSMPEMVSVGDLPPIPRKEQEIAEVLAEDEDDAAHTSRTTKAPLYDDFGEA